MNVKVHSEKFKAHVATVCIKNKVSEPFLGEPKVSEPFLGEKHSFY